MDLGVSVSVKLGVVVGVILKFVLEMLKKILLVVFIWMWVLEEMVFGIVMKVLLLLGVFFSKVKG